MKKITVHSEIIYVIAHLILSLAVAMCAAADFGVSMVVAPAYILSLKLDGILTFGQAEYVVQGILFLILCLILRKIKLRFFCSFLTGVIYGAMLDFWRFIIPPLNPDITPAGSLSLPVNILLFIGGMVLTSLSVALIFRMYIYPQVVDFFVVAVSANFNLSRDKFKICADVTLFFLSVILSLVLFGTIKGIGVGTIVITALNGFMIAFFGKIFDRVFELKPLFPKFAKGFEI